MTTKIELLRAVDLSAKEVYALNRLSLGSNGCIIFELEDARDAREVKARVIRVTDSDGKIISWGLVRKRYNSDRWDFQCYTRMSHRRKGYGSLVYRKAVQVAKGRHNMVVHPHDEKSVGFFNSSHFDEEGYVRTSKPEYKNKLHKQDFE